MATTNPTPTPAPAPQSVGQEILKFLPIFELAANVTLAALSGGGTIPASSVALASAIEGGVNPLILSIQSGQAKTTDAFIALSGLHATLTVMKTEVKDPTALAKIDEYDLAVQAALKGWVTAGAGFDATQFAPVAPIA